MSVHIQKSSKVAKQDDILHLGEAKEYQEQNVCFLEWGDMK